MGKPNSKEIVIAQNAAGGENGSHMTDLNHHLSTANILTTVFIVIATLITLYLAFRVYRKCHLRWVREEYQRGANRGSYLRRRPYPIPTYPEVKISDSPV